MDSVVIEIRAGEGGADAKNLVTWLLEAYFAVADRKRLTYELVDQRPGFVSVIFRGSKVRHVFHGEAGGHRVQRVPPSEKRGRVHTSTVTVAVLETSHDKTQQLDLSEVDIKTTRGSGPGGQHRNTTDSCVIATHRPTGVSVRIDLKSQHQSRAVALDVLAARIAQGERETASRGRNEDRKKQIGCGMRSDKIRTYRQQDDQVVDHVTGKTWKLKKWLRGDW